MRLAAGYRILSTSLVGAAACAILGGCTPEPEPEFRVGLLAGGSGMFAKVSGEPSIKGASLAAKLANDAGGIRADDGTVRTTIVVKKYDPRVETAASSAARALINQERVDVLVGPQLSRHAIPVALIAENAEIPMISPMSSSPATTEGKRFVFRLAFLDGVQSEVIARYAVRELRAKVAGILFDRSTSNSKLLTSVFESAFMKAAASVSPRRTSPMTRRTTTPPSCARSARVSRTSCTCRTRERACRTRSGKLASWASPRSCWAVTRGTRAS